MKPALFLSTPPLAFIAAAMFAGFTPLKDAATGPTHPIPAGPRKRAAVTEESKSTQTDISALLTEMERQMVHFPPPEMTIHDGKGMEECLMSDEHAPAMCGSGMASIRYSMDWARENPAGMFEWLNHHWTVSGYQKQGLANTLFSEWAKQDMAAALAAIPRMTHAESRAQAWVSTLTVLCQKDPAKARELLLQNLDSLEALKRVQFGYDARNARTEFLLALPPGRIRSLFMAENIENLIAFGSDEIKTLVTEQWNQCSIDERRDLVAAGFRVNPWDEKTVQLNDLENLVKQHAESTNDPAQAWSFLYQYGESWAKRDPDSAVSWALAHLKGKERTELTLKLIEHAASTNFDAAMQAWRNLPDGSLRFQAADTLSELAPADHEEDKAMLRDSQPKPGAW